MLTNNAEKDIINNKNGGIYMNHVFLLVLLFMI